MNFALRNLQACDSVSFPKQFSLSFPIHSSTCHSSSEAFPAPDPYCNLIRNSVEVEMIKQSPSSSMKSKQANKNKEANKNLSGSGDHFSLGVKFLFTFLLIFICVKSKKKKKVIGTNFRTEKIKDILFFNMFFELLEEAKEIQFI